MSYENEIYERVYYGSAATGLPPGALVVDDQPGAGARAVQALIDGVKADTRRRETAR